MSTLYCSICASSNLTQVGLSAKQIARGYWKCLDPDCLQIMIPIVMPDLVTPSPAEES